MFRLGLLFGLCLMAFSFGDTGEWMRIGLMCLSAFALYITGKE